MILDHNGKPVSNFSYNGSKYNQRHRDYITNASTGNGNTTGELVTVGGTFQLTNSSDKRLKTNIVDTSIGGLDSVNQMRVVDFDWKASGQNVIGGFIAQELKEVFEPAVVGDENTLEENGDIKPMSVSRERLVPVLLKAVQELSKKVEDLQAQISGSN